MTPPHQPHHSPSPQDARPTAASTPAGSPCQALLCVTALSPESCRPTSVRACVHTYMHVPGGGDSACVHEHERVL